MNRKQRRGTIASEGALMLLQKHIINTEEILRRIDARFSEIEKTIAWLELMVEDTEDNGSVDANDEQRGGAGVEARQPKEG